MAVKHTIRDSKGKLAEVELTHGRAIKRFCLECMGYVRPEIEKCTAPLCPLYPFRLGGPKREMTPQQRNAASDNLMKVKNAQKTRGEDAQNRAITP